ncbi:hypothetical protein BYT27DRAFT_7156411 [Phlegmacium glaucopus]|nr:hypothetical protein BYT27DRAFT_7156411 [Phlegmacium glaucopus]
MTTYVHGSCHCRLNEFRVAFPTASLPTSHALCHCKFCRHCTGQMAAFHVNIEGTPLRRTTDESMDLGDLTAYQTSDSTRMTRYFCVGCGAHLFHQVGGESPYWCVAVGALDKTEGIVEIGCHIYVASTFDGGLADHLKEIDGVELPRYSKGPLSDTLPMGWRSETLKSKQESARIDCLNAYCQCRAIRIYITRPNQLSIMPRAPYPHVIYPVHTRLSTIHNIKDEKWWLAGDNDKFPTKYLASHCVCIHCRRESGFDIQSWAFVSTANVFEFGSQRHINLSQDDPCRPKGLKQYLSSPGRYGEFCGTCGATVFWWQAGRPDIIDISVGLLDQDQDGVRAEGWLKWHKERVGFAEDTKVGRSTIEGLVYGMAKFKG